MNKEEKEQWLYEAYQYTSNFDFSRLDKYEEANDDICIDDLILDYIMLYEFHKEEIERLNKELQNLEKLNNANYQSFIEVNNIINELEKYIKESCWKDDWGVESIYVKTLLNKLQELKGEDKK